MIIISLICVVTAAIFLGIGFVTGDSSVLYASIVAALLGGIFLLIAWFNGRRRRTPLRAKTVSGEDPAAAATWSGAATTGGAPATEVLDRDPAPVASAPVTSAAPSAPTRPIDESVFKPPTAPPAERTVACVRATRSSRSATVSTLLQRRGSQP